MCSGAMKPGVPRTRPLTVFRPVRAVSKLKSRDVPKTASAPAMASPGASPRSAGARLFAARASPQSTTSTSP